MDAQKLKQDYNAVRWDGPRVTGVAPDFAPQEIDSPLFATNLTPHNAAELVRRWNLHNDLLAALEALLEQADLGEVDEETQPIVDQARAAITKAKTL